MKKFITVNKKTLTPKRINVDKIVAYWKEQGTYNHFISVLCIEGYQDTLCKDKLEVTESVEELDRMIKEATEE